MKLDPAQIRQLVRARELTHELEKIHSRDWLQYQYAEYLYGGWKREDGTEAPAHRKAMQMHEAEKALFCPVCASHIGQIGNDPEERWDCPNRDCGYKDIRLPPQDDDPGDWLMAAPTFSKHFPLTNCPYFEQAMGDMIEWSGVVRNQNRCATMYPLTNGDRVHCLSYEQYLKTPTGQASPFEGARWKGAWFDEPPPTGVWVATKRGLLRAFSKYDGPPFAQQHKIICAFGGNQSSKSFSGRSGFVADVRGHAPWDDTLRRGLGRTHFSCTPLVWPWGFHNLYKKAWNRGGDAKHIWVVEFSVYDNPSMTRRAIDEFFAEGLAPEERESRIWGRFQHLSGRIYTGYDSEVHDYDPNFFDPLRKHCDPGEDEPSEYPIIMAVDPHFRRPWMMCWMALMPDGTKYIVDEWPKDPYENLKNSSMGYDEYAEVIRKVEDKFPGGKDRVLWREFDPNLANTPQQKESGSTTMLAEMRKRGFRFRADVNDKITQGHSIVSTALYYDTARPVDELNRPALFNNKNNRNIRHGFENYSWKVETDDMKPMSDKPAEFMKDPMDVVRYCCARKPRYREWKEARNWLARQTVRRKEAIR